jgi:hypothetical protein
MSLTVEFCLKISIYCRKKYRQLYYDMSCWCDWWISLFVCLFLWWGACECAWPRVFIVQQHRPTALCDDMFARASVYCVCVSLCTCRPMWLRVFYAESYKTERRPADTTPQGIWSHVLRTRFGHRKTEAKHWIIGLLMNYETSRRSMHVLFAWPWYHASSTLNVYSASSLICERYVTVKHALTVTCVHALKYVGMQKIIWQVSKKSYRFLY